MGVWRGEENLSYSNIHQFLSFALKIAFASFSCVVSNVETTEAICI